MEQARGERLSWAQRRLLILLGVPALGLAFTITVVSTYVPVLVVQVSGPLYVGILIGGEGFFGIFLPAIVGGFSDRVSSTVRHRVLLLVPCAGLIVVSVAAVGALAVSDIGSLWSIGAALAVLYIGYYACLAPYWTLYPDLVPPGQSGRSRSAESTWRVIGVGLALIGGGVLLDLSKGLPFLVAAVLVVVVVVVLVLGLHAHLGVPVGGDRSSRGRPHQERSVTAVLRLLHDPQIRRLSTANALWNFALAGLRAFVVLYLVVGLGRSSTFVATVVFPLVAVGIGVAAPLSGWFADRFGHIRVMTGALVVYGCLMALPGFTHVAWLVLIIPLGAAGAGTLMTLPFSALMRLLPPEQHGAASGLFGLSRGVGGVLGPVVCGAVILMAQPILHETNGYAAMWLVCAAALLASLPLVRRLRGDARL